MNSIKMLITVSLVIAFAFSINACSNDKSPTEPAMNDEQIISQNIPDSFGIQNENRTTLAIYEAVIDPVAKSFTITPVNRNSQYHFSISQAYPKVVEISWFGWEPNFWAYIRLKHPYPGSGIDGFDPRVIAILPANPNVSMNYSIFNVHANNSVVLDPDGYTKLFDSEEPSIVGNTNPFLSYFRHTPNHIWSSDESLTDSRRWEMDVSGFAGPLSFYLVVDVSTNFPDPPQPIIDNAPEPYIIDVNIGQGLNPGGTASIDVTLLDWQGALDIKCKIESPDLFNGAIELFYSEPGTNPDEYIFSGTISNELYAPQGDYPVLIAAWDIPNNIHMFHEVNVFVSEEIIFNLQDVTPPELNFCPQALYVEGNYAYIAALELGLHVFDISDTLNPIWLTRVELPGRSWDVHVSNGYAYVVELESSLHIVDVSKPESACLVKSTGDINAKQVFTDGDYAYVICSSTITIIDINPVEDAYIVNSLVLSASQRDLFVNDGYAYVAAAHHGLMIIDVDPPEDAFLLNTIDTPCRAEGVYIKDGYAYIADGYLGGLEIIDVDPPESASTIHSVDTAERADSVYVSNGYAFVTDRSGLQVIDVDPPGSAYIDHLIETPAGGAWCVDASDGYACVGGYPGLITVDIDPPESSYILNIAETPIYPVDVCVVDNYAFIADGNLQVLDIEQPEDINIIKTVCFPDKEFSRSYDVFITDGYAYIADYDSGLEIIDIDPLESAYHVNTVEMLDFAHGVFVVNGYAYIAGFSGFRVIDVDPPESAHIVKSIDTADFAFGVYVSDGYAYLANADSGLRIIDIEPPESANIVKTIGNLGDTRDVYVTGGYAYVAAEMAGLRIIDVSSPVNAFFVQGVNTPGWAEGVYVLNRYAYVADNHGGLQIIDIYPPETAYIAASIDTPGYALGIHVSDGHAYLADSAAGLRIIDLW